MIALLTSRLAGPIAAAVAVALLFLTLGQCTRALKAEHALAKAEKVATLARSDLATCRTNTNALNASLDRQSASVAALEAENAARQRVSDKAVSDARSVAASYRRAADVILTTKPKGQDLCAAADRLILESVR
jgi:hypothetical protein